MGSRSLPPFQAQNASYKLQVYKGHLAPRHLALAPGPSVVAHGVDLHGGDAIGALEPRVFEEDGSIGIPRAKRVPTRHSKGAKTEGV